MSNREQGAFWLTQYAKREVPYGAGLTPLTLLDKWHEIVSVPLPNYQGEEYVDSEENTGHTGPSEGGAVVIGDTTAFEFEMKQELDLFGKLLASLNGNVLTSGAGADKSHLVVDPKANVLGPLSFPLIFGSDRFDTTTFFEYRGMVCTRLVIQTDGKGPLQLSGTIQGDGTEINVPGITVPTVGSAIFGKRLYGPQQTLLFGPLGTEDVTSKIRDLQITLTAEVEEAIDHTRAPLVGQWVYTRNSPEIEVALQLSGKRGGTFYNYAKAKPKQNLIFDWLAQISATESIRIKGDAVQPGLAGGALVEFRNRVEQVVNLPLRFHTKAGSNRWDMTVKNQVPAYLQP